VHIATNAFLGASATSGDNLTPGVDSIQEQRRTAPLKTLAELPTMQPCQCNAGMVVVN
jgi:hypothetical protein